MIKKIKAPISALLCSSLLASNIAMAGPDWGTPAAYTHENQAPRERTEAELAEIRAEQKRQIREQKAYERRRDAENLAEFEGPLSQNLELAYGKRRVQETKENKESGIRLGRADFNRIFSKRLADALVEDSIVETGNDGKVSRYVKVNTQNQKAMEILKHVFHYYAQHDQEDLGISSGGRLALGTFASGLSLTALEVYLLFTNEKSIGTGGDLLVFLPFATMIVTTIFTFLMAGSGGFKHEKGKDIVKSLTHSNDLKFFEDSDGFKSFLNVMRQEMEHRGFTPSIHFESKKESVKYVFNSVLEAQLTGHSTALCGLWLGAKPKLNK